MYQPDIVTEEEGKELLKIARNILERHVRHENIDKPKNYPEKFNSIYGVYCSLLKKDGEETKTRSSAVVGLPYPLLSVVDAVMNVVVSVAQGGEKSPSLETNELQDIKIELSLLTEPQLIDAFREPDILRNILPNVDGLLLRYDVYESFLTPQAWVEIKDKNEFLDQLCLQAGLTKEMWKEPGIELYKFQAQILRE